MRTGFDFCRPPEQRRRARELSFYRWLACAALLGVMPVLALAWRIDSHTTGIERANRLLASELQALQPQLASTAEARLRIAAAQTRLQALEQLAARRRQAARLLRATARASSPHARLQRIALQTQRAELRGHANLPAEVQAFTEALLHAGLDNVSLQDMRMAGKNAADGRYEFTLSAPLPSPIPSTSTASAPTPVSATAKP
ncbi:PilN domain-containing protein [Herbaspirillum robiniae]|uniref:PilN domain-containing protein n=1 Tax=Herbaspirillum robiniae TaxID=2014887 RepID=UPI003D76F9DA